MNENDPYAHEYERHLSHSASRILAVMPDDENDLTDCSKALRVLNPTALFVSVRVTTVGGDEATLRYPPGLTIEPLRIARVWETDTSPDIEIHIYTDH